ncbi:Inner membrane protein translocase component YidC, OxaA protein [Fructilactobacillus florum 8D]|uniref:Inner membrane protein translocase component YidC, OxaA protein n=2 Tax=Fructilactobacillus florum TaxID=640331 RepID=W9EFV9_9LACO|nr:membrane protein insertase YidC [Fructilactobacillus florum]EKK20695.1 Inner membrane protein translocase component YidC, OxaA protein [Fructilactobacillus florum 2F]ETO40161.1 Inner membrane protein translocase component YidC, OxaA protein [Fructilactobacillus florum 8D]KRM91821.1 membrane protein OxaA [Fructilactobacillus florum DSM 22689 = JCM 16035]
MKKKRKITLISIALLAAITLSGCVRTDAKGHPYGFVYDYLAIPGQKIMDWLAQFVGGYGWSLIVITVLVRLCLLPVMISQLKKSTIQQEKMNLIKPQLTKLQKLIRQTKDQAEQVALNQQMMQLYRDNNISMTGGIGCLPLLIQLPIFAALYAAIRYSPELSHSVFLGIQLGQRSILLAILSLVVYAVQGYLAIQGMPKSQRKQMGAMMLISPIMIFFVTLSSPAGLGIYFFIGGVFAIVQQLIVNAYRPRIIKNIQAETAKNPPKVVLPDSIEQIEANVEAAAKAETISKPADNQSEKNRVRNQNKQHRPKQ